MALVAGVAEVVCSDDDQQQAAMEPPPSVLHRRSANYQPKAWDYDSICSLRRPLGVQADDGEGHRAKRLLVVNNGEPESVLQAALKDRVRRLLLKEDDDEVPTIASRLRIIDQLQSLGIAYHFEEEVRSILISMHHGAKDDLDLSSSALLYRMLRGHGIPAPSTDILSAFRDDNNGGLKPKVGSDGLVALYEASYLAFPGEAAVLEEARAFAVEKNLQQMPPSFMGHGRLQLPLHWTAPRLQAMWTLQEEHKCSNKQQKRIDPSILQLARVDFNLVQALHRGELAEITKWWKESGLGKKLSFARDRVVECFFCAACIAPEPHLGDCREVLAKTGTLLVHLDDIYDLYGTPHELQAFTDAIGRWDSNNNNNVSAAAGELPEYMKAMYSTICKTSVTAAERVRKKHGHDVLPHYKKAWHDLCKAFLMEAQWQHQGYTPSFHEYLTNGWVTSTGPLLLLHALPTIITQQHQQEQAEIITNMLQPPSSTTNNVVVIKYPRLVELSSRIFRLCNDCATHKAESERGDVQSSIACCVTEMGASEEDARAFVQDAIAETWKELNEGVAGMCHWNPCSAESMANLCLNLARVTHCIYQDGDGITSPTHRMKLLVKDLLFNPI